jgi:hypothetical protein
VARWRHHPLLYAGTNVVMLGRCTLMICALIVFACSGFYVAARDLSIWHVRAYSSDTYAVSRNTGAVPYWSQPPDEIGEEMPATIDFCIKIHSEADAAWLAEALNRKKSRER